MRRGRHDAPAQQFLGGMWNRGRSKDNRAESQVRIARINRLGPRSASQFPSTPNYTPLARQCRSESTIKNLESIQPKPVASRRGVPPASFLPPCLERKIFRPPVPEHVGELPITVGEGEALRPISRTVSWATVTSKTTETQKSKTVTLHPTNGGPQNFPSQPFLSYH